MPGDNTPSERQRWAVTAICGDCLDSDTGRAILTGAVGITTLNTGPVERCILCGYTLANPSDQPPSEG